MATKRLYSVIHPNGRVLSVKDSKTRAYIFIEGYLSAKPNTTGLRVVPVKIESTGD